jgi:hypothetical protein
MGAKHRPKFGVTEAKIFIGRSNYQVNQLGIKKAIASM